MAINFINNQDGNYRNDNEPFALVVSMNPPHMPYDQLPQKYVDMYDEREHLIDSLFNQPSVPDSTNKWGKYYRKHIKNQLAMVTGVDEQFGRIMKALKEKGLDKNTIVVFTSDHGDCLGKYEMISKSSPYEESVTIPFMIRWPNNIKIGKDNLLFSAPDIYPTLLELMSLNTKIPHDVEGTSYAPLLKGKKMEKPTSQLFFMMSGQLSKHRHALDNLKLGERGIRTEQYTLYIDKFATDSTEIYLWDRINDPYQLENIADHNPELVKKLFESELKPWLQKTKDPWLSE
jgi:arylsulfatase A-like enzyme